MSGVDGRSPVNLQRRLSNAPRSLDIALADLHATASATTSSESDTAETILTDGELRERQRANLMKALQRTDGHIYGAGGAAELLGLNPTTLASRLRAFKIAPQRSD
jgi:transcriptional regulator with GAF, ATPase, and Fis domain